MPCFSSGVVCVAWLLAQPILRLVSAAARLTRWFSSGVVCVAWLRAQTQRVSTRFRKRFRQWIR